MPPNARIRTGSPSQNKTIKAGPVPPSTQVSFSFRYFSQYDDYGIGGTDNSWAGSLLEALAKLSSYDVDKFKTDSMVKDAWRYHQIDWSTSPANRQHFDKVASTYLNNETDYPFYQFQVSTSLGRIAGFWDENQIFNIVAVDPEHNLQPGVDRRYEARPTRASVARYDKLKLRLDQIREKAKCEHDKCGVRAELLDLSEHDFTRDRVVVLGLSAEDIEELNKAMKLGISLYDIFIRGVLAEK